MISDDKYPTVAGTFVINMGPMFQKRVLDHYGATIYLPETQELINVWKTGADSSIFPKIPNTTRMVGIGCNYIKVIDSNRVKYINIMMTNANRMLYKLGLSDAIAKKILMDRRKSVYNALVSQCEELKNRGVNKDGFPNFYYHADAFGFMSVFEEYCRKSMKPEQFPPFINQPNQSNPFYPYKHDIPRQLQVPPIEEESIVHKQ